jgi:hypothetical protein
MTLATNHSFDFGESGYRSTWTELTNQGIQLVGAGHTLSEAATPLSTTVRGVKLGWIAAADPATSAVIATPDSAGVNSLELITALETRIRDLHQVCDAVIFLPHWGTEWYRLPSPAQRELGLRLIKAGVDIIIGNHPHVTQVFEFFDGKVVFYSLGNAVAMDISETGAETLKQLPPNLKSLAISIHITTNGKVSKIKMWDLHWQQGNRLIVQGEHQYSFVQRLIDLLKPHNNIYSVLWVLYCIFMEVIFIPIRYRLMGYGMRYVLKRVNLSSVKRRAHVLVYRMLLRHSVL